MLKEGILNPELNALLSRFRHTNTIVIADRGFPYWPNVPTLDLALVNDIPKVLDVLSAVCPIVNIGAAWMATEFLKHNRTDAVGDYQRVLGQTAILFEAHVLFKQRIPAAIGLIRTGDTTPYGNIILESA